MLRTIALLTLIAACFMLTGRPGQAPVRSEEGGAYDQPTHEARRNLRQQIREIARDADLLEQAQIARTLNTLADAIERNQEEQLANLCSDFSAKNLSAGPLGPTTGARTGGDLRPAVAGRAGGRRGGGLGGGGENYCGLFPLTTGITH